MTNDLMTISLTNTGKRYNREWIFRRFSYQFEQGKKYAITGPNGSGKSTLLQVIAGATLHNEGTIEYRQPESGTLGTLADTQHYKYLSIAAPYLELIEEMTAREMLSFHAGFKPFLPDADISSILETVGLKTATNKQIRYYSSGMKQRLKLAQAFFSDTPALLLDEPTTNLDADGIALYLTLISKYTKDRLVIVSSNVKQEYDFCEEVIAISSYK
ncbi:MAG TPA: ABC transporter ATP-binding protein [Ferruginibacter sp.]|nr:ABC transporter ATP-binding protein [Ferruginibacter sp.]